MTQIDPARSIREFYAFHLKRHREAAGLSQPALAALVHVSPQLIGHLENGIRRPTMRLSKSLDAACDLDSFFEGLFPRVIEESGLPAGFVEYAEEETRASVIRLYSQWLLSGLVQTEAYVREVLRAGQRLDRLDVLVAERMSRQEVLQREDPPWLFLLVGEAAIRNTVGGAELMKEQLEHLIKLSEEPRFTVRVVPTGAAAYPGSSFNLLSIENEPDIGFVEGAGGLGQLIEAGPGVTSLSVLFDAINAEALSPTESARMIRKTLEGM